MLDDQFWIGFPPVEVKKAWTEAAYGAVPALVAVFGVFRGVAGRLFRIGAGNQAAHGMADDQKLFGVAFFQSVIDAAIEVAGAEKGIHTILWF